MLLLGPSLGPGFVSAVKLVPKLGICVCLLPQQWDYKCISPRFVPFHLGSSRLQSELLTDCFLSPQLLGYCFGKYEKPNLNTTARKSRTEVPWAEAEPILPLACPLLGHLVGLCEMTKPFQLAEPMR